MPGTNNPSVCQKHPLSGRQLCHSFVSTNNRKMKIVRVTYQVQPEFAAKNKQNIETVMSDLRAIGNPNTKYATYVEEDGVSFMHFAQYPDEETAKIVQGLDSFKKFQTELKESKPAAPLKAVHLDLVAAGFQLFNS